MIDPITQMLRRQQMTRQSAVPSPARDATAALPKGFFPPAPNRSIGPAPTRAKEAKPMRGVMGALMSAGESVHNDLVGRSQTGLQKKDLPLLLSMAAPELFAGSRVAGAVADAAVAEKAVAPAAGLTVEQLQQWRGIEKALNYANDANRANRGVRELQAARAAMPALADERLGVEMQIPMRGAKPPASDPISAMLNNMAETGFAAGKPASAVELPAAGAGRGGSTATAMKAALGTTSRPDFQRMVEQEIARRGGAATPEVEMAATEEIARKLASRGAVPHVNGVPLANADLPEHVVAAATKARDGRTFVGNMHVQAIEASNGHIPRTGGPAAQGFVTNKGRFVSRKGAEQFAAPDVIERLKASGDDSLDALDFKRFQFGVTPGELTMASRP